MILLIPSSRSKECAGYCWQRGAPLSPVSREAKRGGKQGQQHLGSTCTIILQQEHTYLSTQRTSIYNTQHPVRTSPRVLATASARSPAQPRDLKATSPATGTEGRMATRGSSACYAAAATAAGQPNDALLNYILLVVISNPCICRLSSLLLACCYLRSCTQYTAVAGTVTHRER